MKQVTRKTPQNALGRFSWKGEKYRSSTTQALNYSCPQVRPAVSSAVNAIYHLPYKHRHLGSVFNEDIGLCRPGRIGLLFRRDIQRNGNGRLAKRT